MKTWLHTHLPRLRAGDTPDVISVKVPGRRIEYAAWVSLRDAEFRVFQPGRRRCLAEGVRNVHAWVVGTEVDRLTGIWPQLDFPPPSYRQAVYDPWKGPWFVDSGTLEPVHRASWVIMSGKNVFYAE